jgi:saccharopine dehydrogenase-like NADP-dependent oxidoreductase
VEYTITQRPIADTGVYLAIGALLLARGQIKEKGVFPPEFVPHELYFEECTKRGLMISVRGFISRARRS